MWKHWIKKRGISKTAKDLRVTRQTVHNWLKGHAVKEKDAIKMIKLSGYAFTINDFFMEHIK